MLLKEKKQVWFCQSIFQEGNDLTQPFQTRWKGGPLFPNFNGEAYLGRMGMCPTNFKKKRKNTSSGLHKKGSLKTEKKIK